MTNAMPDGVDVYHRQMADRERRGEEPGFKSHASKPDHPTPYRAASISRAEVDRILADDRELIRSVRLAADQRFAVWFVRRYRDALKALADD